MTLKVTYVAISLCATVGASFLPSSLPLGNSINNPFTNNILGSINVETFSGHSPYIYPNNLGIHSPENHLNYGQIYAEHAPVINDIRPNINAIYAEQIPFAHNVALEHIRNIAPLVSAAEITQIPVAEIVPVPVSHGVVNIEHGFSAPIVVPDEAIGYYSQPLPIAHLRPHLVPEIPIPVIASAAPVSYSHAVHVAPIAQVAHIGAITPVQHVHPPSPVVQVRPVGQVLQAAPVTQVLLGQPPIIQQVPLANYGQGQISYANTIQNQKHDQIQQTIHTKPVVHESQIGFLPSSQIAQFGSSQSQYVQKPPVFNFAQGQIKQSNTMLDKGEIKETNNNKPTTQNFFAQVSSSDAQTVQRPPVFNNFPGQITYADAELNQGEVLLTEAPVKNSANGVIINDVPAGGTIQLSPDQQHAPQITADYGAPTVECNCTRSPEWTIGLSPPQRVPAYPSYAFALHNPKTGSSSRQEVRLGNAVKKFLRKPSKNDIDATETGPVLDARFTTSSESSSTEKTLNQTTLADVDPKDEKHRKSDGIIEK